MLYPRGGQDEAASVLDEGARLARHAGDLDTLSWILTMRGYVAIFQGLPEQAATVLQEAEVLRAHV